MESQVLTLSFQLTNVLTRQLFEYDTGNALITMLYDSGAQIPVWCAGKEVLLEAYPDAKKTSLKCIISGFGKEKETAEIYVLPAFELSNGEISFVIENLYIAELSKPFIGADFIISETMLSKTNTTTIRLDRRELQISYKKLDRNFKCTPMRKGKELSGITVWMQDA